VSDLPKEAIVWLLEAGVIVRASSTEEVVEAVIDALSNDEDLSEVDSGI
jgi:hypothetical protein